MYLFRGASATLVLKRYLFRTLVKILSSRKFRYLSSVGIIPLLPCPVFALATSNQNLGMFLPLASFIFLNNILLNILINISLAKKLSLLIYSNTY